MPVSYTHLDVYKRQGLFYMHNLFSMENIDKAVLSIVAWFVYIVLLWGHYHEAVSYTHLFSRFATMVKLLAKYA